jgi:hypothetical protein
LDDLLQVAHLLLVVLPRVPRLLQREQRLLPPVAARRPGDGLGAAAAAAVAQAGQRQRVALAGQDGLEDLAPGY